MEKSAPEIYVEELIIESAPLLLSVNPGINCEELRIRVTLKKPFNTFHLLHNCQEEVDNLFFFNFQEVLQDTNIFKLCHS